MALRSIFEPDESTKNIEGMIGTQALAALSLIGYTLTPGTAVGVFLLAMAIVFCGLSGAYIYYGYTDGLRAPPAEVSD